MIRSMKIPAWLYASVGILLIVAMWLLVSCEPDLKQF